MSLLWHRGYSLASRKTPDLKDSGWPSGNAIPKRIRVFRLASIPGSLYSLFLYGTPRSRCFDNGLGPWNRPGHRPAFCEGGGSGVSYGAHGKGTRLLGSDDNKCRGTSRLRPGGFITRGRLRPGG